MREDNVNNCDHYVNCDDMMKILYHKKNFCIYGKLKYIQYLAHFPQLFKYLFIYFVSIHHSPLCFYLYYKVSQQVLTSYFKAVTQGFRRMDEQSSDQPPKTP